MNPFIIFSVGSELDWLGDSQFGWRFPGLFLVLAVVAVAIAEVEYCSFLIGEVINKYEKKNG